MSDHNFYDALAGFAAADPLRLHMPGHKGKPLPMAEWNALAPLDFTELTPTGDLYGGDDWLEESQRLWAWDWGMDAAFYATGGSTQGIFTLLTHFTRPGDVVLADRVSHKSIHNAMALLDLRPVWLHREWDGASAVTGALSPAVLAQALAEHPEARAVIVTTPTYHGVCTPLEPLAALCHERGVYLLVDGAHGAHLPLVLAGEQNCLLGTNPYACCDGVTVSAHKTLPAPGQTAVVMANGVRMEELRRASALTATTSPSFVMLAALDRLRGWMWEGKSAYQKTAALCEELRRNYPTLPRDDLDPCRFTLQVSDGNGLRRQLEARGIYPEMSDSNHVVCILTAADGEREFSRLRQGLDSLGLRGQPPFVCDLDAPPEPEQVCTPRQARLGKTRRIPLSQAMGRVAAEPVAPYPPGVPVIAPGERVTEKNLAYLRKLCYDMNSALFILEEA